MNEVHVHLPFGMDKQTPSRIVIHSMAQYIKSDGIHSAVKFLKREGLSAHILIDPEGNVMRCRNDEEGAYHARSYNIGSLGLEFLVKGPHDYSSFKKRIKEDWTTSPQIDSGIQIVRRWYDLHDIQRIDRHSDIDPTRKKDPGSGFPWEDFIKEI